MVLIVSVVVSLASYKISKDLHATLVTASLPGCSDGTTLTPALVTLVKKKAKADTRSAAELRG